MEGGSPLIHHGDKVFQEDGFFFADSDIFEIFTLPLVKGDPKTALENPNNVLLTEATARKYFGDLDPIDKTITFEYPGRVKVDLRWSVPFAP